MDEEAFWTSRLAAGGPRPQGSASWTAAFWTAAFWTTVALVASLLVAAQAGNAAAEEAPPSIGPKADCPTCGGSGKATCESCVGKGEIWKPCPICKASGRKPCPVCASEERRASSPGPGRLVCTHCGGKGIRSSGRTCSRCLGEQSIACVTCIGKGTLSCRKQVFDKVCPVCRFVGKVDCPSCRGKPGDPADDARAAARPARSLELEANGKAAALDLEARYAKLTHLHEAHLDIFGDDPRPRLEPLRGEASRALKSLRAEGAADAASAEAIGSFLSRLGSFRRRWGEIREVFLDEYRSFRTTKGVWGSRDRLVADTRGAQRTAAEKQWADRMDIALTIAEQRAAALEAAEPAWLPKEARDLATIWADLRVSAESDLARAATAATSRPKAPPPERPTEAGIEEEAAEEADGPDADLFTPAAAVLGEGAGGAPKEPAPTDLSPRAAAPSAAPASPEEAPTRRPASEDVDGVEDEVPEDQDPERSSTRRSWAPFVWSAAGFAAATILFGILGRRRRFRS